MRVSAKQTHTAILYLTSSHVVFSRRRMAITVCNTTKEAVAYMQWSGMSKRASKCSSLRAIRSLKTSHKDVPTLADGELRAEAGLLMDVIPPDTFLHTSPYSPTPSVAPGQEAVRSGTMPGQGRRSHVQRSLASRRATSICLPIPHCQRRTGKSKA